MQWIGSTIKRQSSADTCPGDNTPTGVSDGPTEASDDGQSSSDETLATDFEEEKEEEEDDDDDYDGDIDDNELEKREVCAELAAQKAHNSPSSATLYSNEEDYDDDYDEDDDAVCEDMAS